jgi:hypothetical protein
VDSSRFDFDPAEAFELVAALAQAAIAAKIELEPREHGDEPLTFRVACALRGGGRIFSRVAEIESACSVEAVLDHGHSVRFRHRAPV